MNRRTLSFLILWLFIGAAVYKIVSPSAADKFTQSITEHGVLTYQDLLAINASRDLKAHDSAYDYLLGIKHSASIYNSMTKHSKQPPLYCLPQGTGLTVSNMRDLMAKFYEQSDAEDQQIYDDQPVARLFYLAMQHYFPCKDRISKD